MNRGDSEVQLHITSKRRDGQPGHLEMLLTPGNTNDGDAQDYSEEHMTYPSPQAPEDEPQDVQRNAQTAGRKFILRHLGTERPQAQQADLEYLQRPGNAHNRHSQRQRAGEITDGCLQSTEDQPQNITQYFHSFVTFTGSLNIHQAPASAPLHLQSYE